MDTRQIIGIIGSALLFIGVFLPIISAPIIGDVNYFQNGKGDGIFILVLAIGSFAIVMVRQYRSLWFTSIASAALLLFTFFNFHSRMNQFKTQMDMDLDGNAFRGLADLALGSVQIQYGWAVLAVGVILLIITAAMKEGTTNIDSEKHSEVKNNFVHVDTQNKKNSNRKSTNPIQQKDSGGNLRMKCPSCGWLNELDDKKCLSCDEPLL